MITRLIFILIIIWSLVAGFLWLSAPLVIWYLFKYDAVELLFVGVLIDAYYQLFYQVPIFTITMTGLYLFFDFIKPQLLMYTE